MNTVATFGLLALTLLVTVALSWEHRRALTILGPAFLVAGLTPIVPGPAPHGGMCDANAECASGLCNGIGFGSVCAGCQSGGCSGAEVCGLEEPASRVLYQSTACIARNNLCLRELPRGIELTSYGLSTAAVRQIRSGRRAPPAR